MTTSQDWELANTPTNVSFHGMIDNDYRTNQIRGLLSNKICIVSCKHYCACVALERKMYLTLSRLMALN